MVRIGTIILVLVLSFSTIVNAATVAAVTTNQRQTGLWGDWTLTWSSITTTNNTCAAAVADRFSHMTVQATGTWGGGTIALFGSNDGTTWFALTSIESSSAISFTVDGMKTIVQTPVQQIKWTLSGGDGTTALKVIVKGQR